MFCTIGLCLLAAGGCEPSQPSLPKPASSDKEATASAPPDANALREAAVKGDLKAVRKAVESKVDVNAVDEEGHTALMLAAFDGHTDVIKFLLEHGARCDDRDAMQRTALLYAASGPNLETVKALLDAGADINAIDGGEGFSALMYAAAEGHVDVVRELLKRGADKTLRDVDGDTAQEFAHQNGHREIVELLER
jgi:ankyrin repeat protein